MATFVKANIDGAALVFDFESITAREYKVIKRHTGLKMGEFEKAFSAFGDDGIDVELVDCLRWLFLKRAGQNVDPETLPDYNPLEFMSSFDVIADKGQEAPLVPEADTRLDS